MILCIYIIFVKLVKVGKVVFVVCVFDFGGEGGIYGKVEEFYVEVDGKWICLVGDWKYCIGFFLKGFLFVLVFFI